VIGWKCSCMYLQWAVRSFVRGLEICLNGQGWDTTTFHLDNVASFFQEVVENEHFLVFCINDYHNVHTKHRPETKTVHMSMLLVKVFPNIKAISNKGLHTPLWPPTSVQPKQLSQQIGSNMAGLSELCHKYARLSASHVLWSWTTTTPVTWLPANRNTENEIMENTKLIDSIHLFAIRNFLAPFMGTGIHSSSCDNWFIIWLKIPYLTICQNVVPLTILYIYIYYTSNSNCPMKNSICTTW
jgi:hypothetical protein